jgi:hypothetical protein
MKRYDGIRFIVVIRQLQVTIQTNCQLLTHCMKVSYAVRHERVNSLLLQCIVSILRVLIIFLCRYVKCSIYYIKGTV